MAGRRLHVRPEIQQWAQGMERQLRREERQGQWKEMPGNDRDYFNRLVEGVFNLDRTINDCERGRVPWHFGRDHIRGKGLRLSILAMRMSGWYTIGDGRR